MLWLLEFIWSRLYRFAIFICDYWKLWFILISIMSCGIKSVMLRLTGLPRQYCYAVETSVDWFWSDSVLIEIVSWYRWYGSDFVWFEYWSEQVLNWVVHWHSIFNIVITRLNMDRFEFETSTSSDREEKSINWCWCGIAQLELGLTWVSQNHILYFIALIFAAYQIDMFSLLNYSRARVWV